MLLVTNARIRTMNPRQPRAEAIAFDGDKIAAVGGDAEARAFAGPGAQVIDAGGRTVLPGFVDPHDHLLSTAESLASVDARYPVVASMDDLVTEIAKRAAETPPGVWIRAFGMDDAKYPTAPSRFALDEATTEHPVIVYHVSGHHALVNSAAIRWRGLSGNVPDPAGGSFDRDEAGRLTGMCRDAAMELILPVAVDIGCHGPNYHTDLPAEQLGSWLEEAGRHYLAAGLTTVADPQVSRRELTVYRALHAAGRLPVRTVCLPLSHQLDALSSIGLAGPFGDDWLRLGPMKFYCDGTLLGGTAMFSEPYGEHGEFAGSTYWAPGQLTELVARAAEAGWQVAIHTQGDRAMGYSLEAIRAAVRVRGDDARPRIEHCGYPTPAQIKEFASLGVIPVNQPNFLFDSGRDFVRRLGARAQRLQPIREELDAGLRPVLSSDSFVSSFRALTTISNAVLRQTREGDPIGLSQAMTLDEALRAHTIDAAFSLRMEDQIGSLEPGKLADAVILDSDLDAVTGDALRDVSVSHTVLGGRLAYSAA
jgi:predicted amidohydrolase YtcJ